MFSSIGMSTIWEIIGKNEHSTTQHITTIKTKEEEEEDDEAVKTEAKFTNHIQWIYERWIPLKIPHENLSKHSYFM